LDAEKEHSHPPNYDVTKRQLTVSQSCSATSGRSFNLENISTAESVRGSADVVLVDGVANERSVPGLAGTDKRSRFQFPDRDSSGFLVFGFFGFFTGSELVLKLNRWRCDERHKNPIGWIRTKISLTIGRQLSVGSKFNRWLCKQRH